MIGLKRGTVRLEESDRSWIKLFKNEKDLIFSQLGSIAVDVQHIGSTSIPGVPAKPIIDIDVGIKTMDDAERCIKPLRKANYQWIQERSETNHWFFAKGPEEMRTYYLHLVQYQGSIWNNDILFRDFLTVNKQYRQKYIQIKKKLAEEYSNHRSAYTAKKKTFIEATIEVARNWT